MARDDVRQIVRTTDISRFRHPVVSRAPYDLPVAFLGGCSHASTRIPPSAGTHDSRLDIVEVADVLNVLCHRKIISDCFLASAGICFLFGIAVTVGDVCLRAVAGTNISGAIELSSLSIGFGALLSMPVCYAKRAHVSAKLLSELAPGRFLRPLGLLGSFASVIFAALLVLAVGENSLTKLSSAETTTELGLPIPMALTVVTLALLAALVAAAVGVLFAVRHEKA
ncbi:MAG: TRAP transporter small permease [Mesorhizobium sp.]|nr:MAG: TRAP transporter small permease [Mesorhizobium sp.]